VGEHLVVIDYNIEILEINNLLNLGQNLYQKLSMAYVMVVAIWKS
jgi:hypothetical protein